MSLIDNFQQLLNILLGTICIFIVLFFFYRKHVLHTFDPLMMFLFIHAFTIEMAFITIDNVIYLINFLACEVCFMIGYLIAAGKPLQKADMQSSHLFKQTDYFELSVLKWYCFFGLFVLLIANLILIKQNGLIILADDPSTAKVETYTGGVGLGIVRRMNLGMLYFVGISIAALFLIKNQKRYAVLLVLLVLIPAMGGSKGALLYFIILSGLLSCFKDVKKGQAFKRLKKGSIALLLLAIFLMGFLISGGSTSDTLQDKLFKVASRFLFYGDSIMYYYNSSTIHFFAKNNIASFIADELNSILGFLRIVPYSLPMGYQLINYFYNIHSETFGPNVPFYIKGNIYFGYYGAFIYSLLVGSIIGFARRLFYHLVKKGSSSLVYSLLIIHLNLVINTFAQDSQLFITVISDTVMLSLPVLAASLLLHISCKNFAT